MSHTIKYSHAGLKCFAIFELSDYIEEYERLTFVCMEIAAGRVVSYTCETNGFMCIKCITGQTQPRGLQYSQPWSVAVTPVDMILVSMTTPGCMMSTCAKPTEPYPTVSLQDATSLIKLCC